MRREDLISKSADYLNKNCTVCAEHFEPIMFLNDLRNRLHTHAVPTIVNVNNPPRPVTAMRPLPQKHPLQESDKSRKRRKTEKGI